MKRTRRKQSAAEKAAHEAFRDAVLNGVFKGAAYFNDCYLCSAPGVDPHHIIPKQTLKAHTSTVEDEARWQIVHDPRNGVPLCRRCHERVTNRVRPLMREEVPEAAWEFAREQGLEWKLELECPSEKEVMFG